MARSKKTGPACGKKKSEEFIRREIRVIYDDKKKGWCKDGLKFRKETFRLMQAKWKCVPFTLCKGNLKKPIEVTMKADKMKYRVLKIMRTLEEPKELKKLKQHSDCGCDRPRFFHFLPWPTKRTRTVTYSVHSTCEEGWKAKGPYYRITLVSS
jgi:hypothetical protein